MLEPQRVNVNGKDGWVVYMDAKFNPVEFEQATKMKIVFDNGDTLWALPMKFPPIEKADAV